MIRKLHTILTTLALMLACGTASASLNATDEAALAKHVLTENELNRLAAVMEDARARGQGASINMTGADTLDAIAGRIDTEPGAHAMLASHGFTAREYVVAVLSTLHVAMKAQMGGEANGPNASFYRARQAQIDRMMDIGPAAGQSEDLSSLNTQKPGECTKVAMGSVAVVPLSMGRHCQHHGGVSRTHREGACQYDD